MEMTSIIQALSSDDLHRALETTVLLQWKESVILRFGGSEGLDLIHRLSTNDLAAAKQEETVATCFLTDKGRLVDCVRVIVGQGDVLLLASPGNSARLASWIERFIIMEDARVVDCSGKLKGFSVVGPLAGDTVRSILGCVPGSWQNVRVTLNDTEVIVSRRGSLEDDHYDVIVPAGENEVIESFETALPVPDPLLSNTLRIWKGIPAFPGEVSEEFNPYEAGFAEFLNDRKGCYVGQEIVARLSTYDKIQRGLTGILLSARPGEGTDLFSEGTSVGKLTSISSLSVAGWYPALAIVRKNILRPRMPIETGTSVRGFIVPLPFSMNFVESTISELSGNGREAT